MFGFVNKLHCDAQNFFSNTRVCQIQASIRVVYMYLKIILGVDAGSRRASAKWLAGPNEWWAIPTAPHGRFMGGGEGCHSEARRLVEGLRRSSPSLPGTEGPLAAAQSRKASTSSPCFSSSSSPWNSVSHSGKGKEDELEPQHSGSWHL